ncbi:MAG TPA: zf-TFIIB domain-containing protein [Thermoanaerobaculia bacterium]|nr:zf-TFIIB domain-containing protein [Thermoanaerobaculia bacterium]
MNCPNCSTALERKKFRGRAIEVDRCPKCGGVWFDDGEIASVVGANPLERLTIPAKAAVKEKMLCPRCGKALLMFNYPGTMTLIEGCRSCSGLWVDAPEFQEIAKAHGERKMTCPSCGQEQPAAESCSQCGIIIKKFVDRSARPSDSVAPPSSRPPSNEQSVAVGGVKGSLLNFVNTSLSRLMEMVIK